MKSGAPYYCWTPPLKIRRDPITQRRIKSVQKLLRRPDCAEPPAKKNTNLRIITAPGTRRLSCADPQRIRLSVAFETSRFRASADRARVRNAEAQSTTL